MASLFGGGSPAPPPPPPMPALTPPTPMPVPDKDEERTAAFKQMAVANAGKTTRASTIIGGLSGSDGETLG